MTQYIPPKVLNWEDQRQSFDSVAEAYDAYRPGYPQELITTIISTAQLTASSRLLEIGTGTGKATVAFAPLGCSILGVEPGSELVRVALRRVENFPRVAFQQVRFEDLPLPSEPFDLVFSAQAFHWINPEIGLPKAAAALKPGGWLALFWNRYPGISGPLALEIRQAYDQTKLSSKVEPKVKCEHDIQWRQEQIEKSGLFSTMRVLRFAWSARYTVTEYLGLLGTYSDHITLPSEQRTKLFTAIAAAIERHGGFIDRPYIAALHLAQR